MHGHFDDYDKIGDFTHLQGDRKNLNLVNLILLNEVLVSLVTLSTQVGEFRAKLLLQ